MNLVKNHVFAFLSFKSLAHAHFVKTSITHNKYSTPGLKKDIDQFQLNLLLNIIFKARIHFPSYNFFNRWFL